MKETIFHLQYRGAPKFIGHFIIFNLVGLYYIDNKIYNKIGEDFQITFKDKTKIVKKPSNDISYPIKIHMDNVVQYMTEAFDIIKDKFILIKELPEDYEIINIYGGDRYKNNFDFKDTLTYIRELFLNRITKTPSISYKKIFITRKDSFSSHNIFKRCIKNEEELKKMLNKYDFTYIVLENYSFNDKIQLFNYTDIIISSHSAALTFIIFCKINVKIVEILNKGTDRFLHDHYKDISKNLKLNGYNRYSSITEDKMGNFNIDIKKFEEYLLNHKILEL